MPRFHRLPLRNPRRKLVLLRPRERFGRQAWRELVPHVLPQHRRDLGLLTEVTLGTRIPTSATRMNEIWQRLRPCCAFMKIGALSAE